MTSNVDILSPTAAIKNPKNVSSSHNLCKIKVEHNIDAYTHQQKPVMDYVENNVDNNITSDSKNLPLKRIYSDEDTNTSCSKKRHSNVPYASSDSSDDQQNVSCKSFIDQEFSELSSDFNQYNNINPQSINVAESPNSILTTSLSIINRWILAYRLYPHIWMTNLTAFRIWRTIRCWIQAWAQIQIL